MQRKKQSPHFCLNIAREVHRVVKEFCNDNGFNMGKWVGLALLKLIAAEKAKKDLLPDKKD